jgi:hypothetical protein
MLGMDPRGRDGGVPATAIDGAGAVLDDLKGGQT